MPVKYEDLPTKQARIDFLKHKMETDRRWAERGCVRIYEYQTASEQASGHTHQLNGVGFSGADSEILSSFAEQINAGRFVGSPKQLKILHQKMTKYAGQLEKIAARKAAEAVEPAVAAEA